jgi:carboxyl-terminal processing protease
MALGLVLGAALGCQLKNFLPGKTLAADDPLDVRLITEAWNIIQRVYVDRPAIQPQRLTYGALSGMVDALGDTDHSRFLTPEMVKREENFSSGKLEGIGIEVQMKNNQVTIVAPLDGSPAQRAGLKAGDVILKVNGEEMKGLPLDQVVERVLGPPGSSLKLTILRPSSQKTMEISLVRARITLQSVFWEPLTGTTIAYLRIAALSKGVNKDLKKALVRIKEEKLDGLILDLRNNVGGLFDEAVDSASEFLGRGNVLLEKDSFGKIVPVPVKSGGLALSIHMVVLINGGTSSGAEIIAGALQDQHRAKLVGEKTFGTGTVLETFSLSDGSALLLAVREWLTPDGRSMWHRGIPPDVTAALPPEATPLYPEAVKGMSLEKIRLSGDEQLLRAIDLLTPWMRGQAFIFSPFVASDSK